MGCDIHVYCELKDTIKDVVSWRSADRFELNHYFGVFDDETEQYRVDPVYRDRDYTLFNCLAGVRGGRTELEVMDEPRGIPDDICKTVREEYERWDCDGHSHSWFTLQELYDYNDKEQEVVYSGLLSPEQLKEFDENGTHPTMWCQGTNIEGYERREWTVKQQPLKWLLEAVEARAKDELWVFGDERVPKEKAERFRIVFWFDN